VDDVLFVGCDGLTGLSQALPSSQVVQTVDRGPTSTHCTAVALNPRHELVNA
jgi:hypothetical protein